MHYTNFLLEVRSQKEGVFEGFPADIIKAPTLEF